MLMPAMGGHGYVFPGFLPDSAQTIAFPLFRVCAVLAARGERLGRHAAGRHPHPAQPVQRAGIPDRRGDLRLLIDFPAALLQETAPQASMGLKGIRT